ncbi:hypothetical protein, partial [Novacetimonas hansenii]|uniref:hypothetical protein n=1 Tax=Novacetimonas hansenii TaxID=436 RepID=UPI0039ECBE1A
LCPRAACHHSSTAESRPPMGHILSLLGNMLFGLVGLILAGIVMIEGVLAAMMDTIGVHGQAQRAVLTIMLIALIIAAFRVFGRMFGLLAALFLMLMLLQALFGDPADGGRTHDHHAEASSAAWRI